MGYKARMSTISGGLQLLREIYQQIDEQLGRTSGKNDKKVSNTEKDRFITSTTVEEAAKVVGNLKDYFNNRYGANAKTHAQIGRGLATAESGISARAEISGLPDVLSNAEHALLPKTWQSVVDFAVAARKHGWTAADIVDSAIQPAQISEAEFRKRALGAARQWFVEKLDRWAEGADAHELSLINMDRESASPEGFGWAPDIAAPPNIAFALGRDPEYGSGGDYTDQGVPPEAVEVLFMQYYPEYAGQGLGTWFAFDRRNGRLLEEILTVD